MGLSHKVKYEIICRYRLGLELRMVEDYVESMSGRQ